MPESTKVVDSWAMVAWIQDEPAAPTVENFLQDADSGNIELLMSWLNVAETFYITGDHEIRQCGHLQAR